MTHPSWTAQSISSYLAKLASDAPTPGGGGAACLAGALGADLGLMALSVTRRKTDAVEFAELEREFRRLDDAFLQLAEQDEEAFRRVLDAQRMAKEDPTRRARLEEALECAASVPLRAAALAGDLLRALRALAASASVSIVSDVGVAAHLAWATVESSLVNVRANLRYVKNADLGARLSEERLVIEEAASPIYRDTVRVVGDRLATKG